MGGLAPGTGGITRGGGSGGDLFGDDWRDDLEGFKATRLPSARHADPGSSTTVAVTVEAPEVAPEGEAAGLVDVGGAEGEAVWRRRLAPRHRGAVERFFSDEDGR